LPLVLQYSKSAPFAAAAGEAPSTVSAARGAGGEETTAAEAAMASGKAAGLFMQFPALP
jgi:hypothetical protein